MIGAGSSQVRLLSAAPPLPLTPLDRRGAPAPPVTRGIQAVDKTEYDRLIVITDEQAQTYQTPSPKVPGARCYLINVASARNGVGYGAPWTHLDGFSEHVIRWIAALEGE